MIAALPMYAAPPGVLQSFWSALCKALDSRLNTGLGVGSDASFSSASGSVAVALPQALCAPSDLVLHWCDPQLLLSQTCGYPLSTFLAGKVQVVGTFVYQVAGAQGSSCRSQLVCRADDARSDLAQFAQGCLAYNAQDSQSGYNALRAMVAQRGAPNAWFADTCETGAHVQSLDCVLQGKADMAAVDCVTLALWQRAQPQWAQQLRVFGQTPAYPGLPLITALGTPAAWVQALRESLQQVTTDPAHQGLCQALCIQGFVPMEASDYQCCLEMQNLAYAQGVYRL